MNKKRLLIVLQSISIGGITGSLYSLLSLIDTTKVEVDVFPRSQSGDFKMPLPNCRVLSENVWLSSSMVKSGMALKFFNIVLHGIRKIVSHIGVDMYKYYGAIGGRQIHSDQYDAVIGFAETMAPIICYYPAKKRINWIHCDYRRYTQRDEKKYYDRIDRVVCVSEFVRRLFCEIYPQYLKKTIAVHNVINADDLKRKAQETISDSRFDNSHFTLVSCGRLDPVKQFSKIAGIAAQLKNYCNKEFRWYIIGGGDALEQAKIETEIERNCVGNEVLMLGMKSNPYPYIAKSDIYVCTSYSESFSMVINEAKALGKYVVSNDFPSVRESLKGEMEGTVCTIDNMPQVIADIILSCSSSQRGSYISENDCILKQFYSLL